MGGGGFGEGEDAVDHRLEAAEGDEFHHRVELGLGTHVGAEERELAAEEEAEVELGVVAGGDTAGDEAAAGSEAGDAVVPGSNADVFKDDVNAALAGEAADFVADFLRLVVDEMAGAEIFGGTRPHCMNSR